MASKPYRFPNSLVVPVIHVAEASSFKKQHRNDRPGFRGFYIPQVAQLQSSMHACQSLVSMAIPASETRWHAVSGPEVAHFGTCVSLPCPGPHKDSRYIAIQDLTIDLDRDAFPCAAHRPPIPNPKSLLRLVALRSDQKKKPGQIRNVAQSGVLPE